jgi:hypothetical protein
MVQTLFILTSFQCDSLSLSLSLSLLLGLEPGVLHMLGKCSTT